MSFDRRRHALPGRRRPPTKTRFPGTSKVASHERESSICLWIRRASSLSTSLAGRSARSRYGIDFASANRRARSSSADPPCGEDGQLKLGGRRITAETILTGYITDAGLRNRRLRRSGWCGGDLQPAEDRAMIARINGVTSLWDSLDAVRGFAGERPQVAVHFPEDAKLSAGDGADGRALTRSLSAGR